MDEIPHWFRFAHLIIPICALISLYFLYQILSHTFLKNKSSETVLHRTTKIILVVSISLSYSYLIVTTFQTIFMFLPMSIYSSLLCSFLSSYRMFSYVSGRLLVYLFFTSRTNDIFKDTYLRFSKRSKYFLSIYLLLLCLTITGPSIYIYFTLQTWSINTCENDHIGSYCMAKDKSESNASKYLTYTFLWGSLNDVFLAVFTVFWMASKLFILIIESENKRKSVHSRFSIHDQLSSINQLSQAESNSPRTPSDGPDILQPQHSDSTNTHMSKISKSSMRVSRIHAIDFHKKTEDHNEIILLIAKFLIILFCVILSSQCALVLFVVLRDSVLIVYSLDTFINTICLYLSFSFSGRIYNRYLCGRFCTKCCFSIVKTITLQCSSYERHLEKENDNYNKCCVYCRCCCFGYCCDDKITIESTTNIYSLAKFEVELMIMSNIKQPERSQEQS
eukprot:387613_1